MVEVDQFQCFVFGGGDYFVFVLVVCQVGFDQGFGQYQVVIVGIDQCVVDFWMYVQCLVGWDGLGCGGLDDDLCWFVQGCQVEGCGQFVGICYWEVDVDGW